MHISMHTCDDNNDNTNKYNSNTNDDTITSINNKATRSWSPRTTTRRAARACIIVNELYNMCIYIYICMYNPHLGLINPAPLH